MIKNHPSSDRLIILVFLYEFLLIPSYLYLHSNGMLSGFLDGSYSIINIILLLVILVSAYRSNFLKSFDTFFLCVIIYISTIYIINQAFDIYGYSIASALLYYIIGRLLSYRYRKIFNFLFISIITLSTLFYDPSIFRLNFIESIDNDLYQNYLFISQLITVSCIFFSANFIIKNS